MNPFEDLKATVKRLGEIHRGIPSTVQIPRRTADRFVALTKEQWHEWGGQWYDPDQIETIRSDLKQNGPHALGRITVGPTRIYVADNESDDCDHAKVMM